MFEDSLFDSGCRNKTTSPTTVALSLALQCFAVGVLIVIPLLYTEALPRAKMLSYLLAPPPAPRTQAAAPARPVAVSIKPRPQRELTEPAMVPEHAIIIRDELLPPAPVVGFVSIESVPTIADALGGQITVAPTPPPPPPAPAPTAPVQVGGDVMAARLMSQLRPSYPALARQARIQGTVRLQAIIDRDGAITNLAVLSGYPLLISAAIEAVRQWRYQPTKLNGVPVEVETTVDVNFILGG